MSSDEPSWYRNFKGIACGTLGGIAVTLAGHPFDTLKVRLQTQSRFSPLYSGLFDCLKKTMKWEGLSGLYKGVASPICGQIVFRSILFTSFYESLRFFKSLSPDEKLSVKDHFLSGAITGLAAAPSDSAIELVRFILKKFKSKLQFQIISEKNNIPLSMKYRSVSHSFIHTLGNYGVRGVFQGLGPTIARDLIGYSVYFGLNEHFKRQMTPLGQTASDLGMAKIMAAAGVSGIAFWTLTYNIDVIKSAMMADDIDFKRRKYKNMVHCARKLYKTEGGYSRFWRGFSPCLLRAFFANAIMLYVVDITRKYFPTYSTLKKN